MIRARASVGLTALERRETECKEGDSSAGATNMIQYIKMLGSDLLFQS